jgi:hypothetical protein
VLIGEILEISDSTYLPGWNHQNWNTLTI